MTSLSSLTNGCPRNNFPHILSKLRQRPKRLLIHRLVPRRPGRPHQQERIEKRIVDRPLQRMSLMQPGRGPFLSTFHAAPVFCRVNSARGLHLKILPVDPDSLRMLRFPQSQPRND